MNILEILSSQLGAGTIEKLSGVLGESTESTKSAVGAAIPSLLSQIAGKAETEEGANELFDMIGDDDGSSVDGFADMLSGDGLSGLQESGGNMLSGLLGSNASGMSSVLSRFTGLGGGKMTSLLGMLAPLVMGSLGKAKSSMGLDASGLSNMLSQQSADFKDALPGGLGDQLGSLSGLGAGLRDRASATTETVVTGVSETAGNVVDKTTEAVGSAASSTKEAVGSVATGTREVVEDTAAAGGGLMKRLLPLLGLLLLGLLAFFAFRGCGGDAIDATKNAGNKAVNATKDVGNKAVDATKNAGNKAIDATKNAGNKAVDATKNAGNKAVDATKNAGNKVADAAKKTASSLGLATGSKEAEFANALSSGKARVGSNFILDKVTFASGSANLERSSYAQLNNIVKVMKGYPNMKVQLVGHTDNTGNADGNTRLSKSRAAAVLNYLSNQGINKVRMTSNGIGGSKPISSNDSADGRKKNRRVEAVITSLN